MALYTGRQLVLLVGLLGVGVAGLGIEHWRAHRPDLAERLEALDRDIAERLGAAGAPRAARAGAAATGMGPAGAAGGDPPGAGRPDTGPTSTGGATAGAADHGAAGNPGPRPGGAAGSIGGRGLAASGTGFEARPPKRSAPPSGEPPPGPLDLNRASLDDLTTLPGVGPALAARIVEARTARGPFTSVEDLRGVRGVGPATLARLRPYVTTPE